MKSLRKAFTLVELLIVIAILAVLASAIIVVLNPGELLAQTRDATRISDLESAKKAFNLLQTDNPAISLGLANLVYVSLAASAIDCSGLGLPALPTGYQYRCVTNAGNLRNIDGTGWIPVDFRGASFGPLFSTLPIDPSNNSAAGLYYTYISSGGGAYELTALFESKKYLLTQASDGGVSPGFYEVGANLKLSPFLRGSSLAGYANFKNWTLYNGATVDSNGVLHFTAYGQYAESPYIPVNQVANWSTSMEVFQTIQSPYPSFQPNGGELRGSSYFDVNFLPTANSAGYTSNGEAQPIILNSWRNAPISNYLAGMQVVYLKIYIYSNSTYTPPAYDVRNPSFSSQ